MRRLLLAAALAVLAGCQQSPPPPPATAPVPEVDRLRAEAEGLLARGDHAGAVERFQAALALSAEDVALRFGLGTALSHLNRRAEAIEQFRWVLARGKPDSQEVQEARRWLLSVGALVEPALARGTLSGDEPSSQAAAEPKGQIKGRTEWKGVSPRDRFIKGRVTLQGDDDNVRGVQRGRPFRLGDVFEFKDLPPGRYRLIAKDEDKDVQLWDQRVVVEAGKAANVELTNANSPVSPDAYPGPRADQ